MSPDSAEFHPAAMAEARAAREWYEQRSPATARAFLGELDRGVALLVEAPGACPPYLHGTRHYVMRRFPFQLVYREGRGTVLVVAVAHVRRRPGYWKAR